jgi:hypothetical protein
MRYSDTKRMHIQNLMHKIVEPWLTKQNTDYRKILWHWSSMLKDNAFHIFPTRLVQNVLHVKSDTKGSLFLQFQKLMIVETINLFLGKDVIKDIRSVPWLKYSKTPTPVENRRPLQLSNKSYLNQINDPMLKSALENLLEL